MLKGFVGGAIYADVEVGGDDVIVLLHGWGRTRSDFFDVAHILRHATPSPTIVNFDLPGFGSSPEPDGGWGTDRYADLVQQALGELIDLEHPPSSLTLVGHSFGGRVAVQLSGRQLLEPLTGLVLSGVPLLRGGVKVKQSLSYRMVRSLARSGLVPAAVLERSRQKHGSADYRATHGVMRDVFVKTVNEHYDDLLVATEVPVTLVWGSDDHVVPPHVAERSQQFFASSVLEVLPEVGHMVPLEAPSALAAATCVVAGLKRV